MKNLYLSIKEKRQSAEDLKNQILFGLMFGPLLFVFGAVFYFSVSGLYEIIFVCTSFTGLILICLGILIPSALNAPYKAITFFGNKIGNVIFKAILTVIYVFLIIPVGFLGKKKRTKYGLYEWDDKFSGKETAFVRTADYKEKNLDTVVVFPKLLNIYRLLGRIIKNKWFIIIPTTILLIILGLIYFFAATNVVSFFIYTMF